MKIDLNVTYYYIINEDIKMSKGKIAAQVSHVAMLLSKMNKPIGRAIILKTPFISNRIPTIIKIILDLVA